MADNYLESQYEKLLPKVLDPETGYERRTVRRKPSKR